MILAVPHKAYLEMPRQQLLDFLRPDGVLMDVKSVLDPATLPKTIHYWSL